MNISAIIRTKNSAQTLEQCLESLSNQAVPPDEVIIVDSGSTDTTLEIAKKHQCQIVLYPADTKFNYSKALNLGIEVASGKYILIVSSHVRLKYVKSIDLMLQFITEWNQIYSVSLTRDSNQTIKSSLSFNQVIWKLINRQNFQGQGMYNFCSLIRKLDWETYHFNESIPRCEDQDWIKYFYKERNVGSIVITYPTVFYDNPYYNAKKDAWDYITLGRYIHPYFTSKKFILELLNQSFSSLLKMKFNKAIYNLTIIYLILYERLMGVQVQSEYNTLHEKGVEIS